MNIYFPQIFKLCRRDTLPRRAACSGPVGLHKTMPCDYALCDTLDRPNQVEAWPIDRLLPTDDRSLIVHHFWSLVHASVYAKSAEDHLRPQPLHPICENGDGIFTITLCRTNPRWPGPTIFYIADSFEDDSELGVSYWEAWAGCDGHLHHDEIFHETP